MASTIVAFELRSAIVGARKHYLYEETTPDEENKSFPRIFQ
jgi:hypothetical protein